MPNIDHLVRLLSALLLAAMLGSCSTERALIPPPLEMRKAPASPNGVDASQRGDLSTRVSDEMPRPPAPTSLSTIKETVPAASSANEKAEISLMFDQLPLPNFIQVVYGKILKLNFSVDSQVAARTDLVTLRTPNLEAPSQVREITRMLLKSYGIAVTDVGGFLRIVPDNTMQGYAPEIRRGRALPETPLPLRPIFQLVELNAVLTQEVSPLLSKMYGQKLSILDDGNRNALLISGQSDDVTSAMEAIRVLDQPQMRGQKSVRIDPMFWSAQELSKKLNEILSSEGYRNANVATANTPVIVLPIQAINAIIVFSGDAAILAHVVDWAKELDKPASKGGGYFTYKARYSDAQELAKTVRDLLGAGVATPAAAGQAQAVAARSRVVVNASTNSLIFQGGMEDYTSILNLLQQLDQPAKAALIEVTVAEVNLTDVEQLGIEWTLNQANAGGAIWVAGTLGGLGIGTGGLTVQRFSLAGNPRMVINALATANRGRILSSPRILARNGETATIQVGQEVPVITSQQTTPTTGGTGGILQSVQYRTTGVILKVKPVIHAGDRIELEVSQEVSAAQSTTTGVSSSPTISTRKVETKLSLKDGATVLLGGLMSHNESKNQSGVPILKDIPGIGQLFRVDGQTSSNTELIVLITPYIISDDKDADAITEAFRNRLGSWAHPAPTAPVKQGTANRPALTGANPNMVEDKQSSRSKLIESQPNEGLRSTSGPTPEQGTKP